jgi:hypothetical protein
LILTKKVMHEIRGNTKVRPFKSEAVELAAQITKMPCSLSTNNARLINAVINEIEIYDPSEFKHNTFWNRFKRKYL